MDTQTTIVVPPGGGKAVPRPDTGGTVTLKLTRESTGGAITVWESNRAAGDTGGPGLHSHPGFDEVFYVLAGEYLFTIDGTEFPAPAGTLAFIPRGAFHTFASTGRVDGRLLAFAVPGGVEDFFEEMAAADASRSQDVATRHGVVFVSPD